MSPSILLDTCALIFLMEGTLPRGAVRLLGEALAERRPALVSPVSAWEIGQLVGRGRLRMAADPLNWFNRATSLPGMALGRLPHEVLIASSFLPGSPPRDPVDRIMIASARASGASLMTSDRLILGYAEEGHLSAIAC